MSKIQLYGLPNCDSTLAATKWLKEKGYEVLLHNYKTDGIAIENLQLWSKELGWEKLLNKRSTTWRALPKKEQDNVTNEPTAILAMHKNTNLIKRPVIEFGNKLLLGFDPKVLSNTFK